MTATLRSLRSLLLSVAVLLAGHGLQLTLLPLKAQTLGWSEALIGLTGSAYYLGFLLGCVTIAGLVRRVGHIRAFTAAVAVACMALIAASMQESYPLWLLLRCCTGAAMAALYTIIESWLNDQAADGQRGAVLAVYTMISLGAMALGQMLLDLPLGLDELFPAAALLIVAATLPVALTDRPQPGLPAAVRFSWARVFAASQVGVVCAGLSGVAAGLLWTLGAVFASGSGDGGETDPELGARFVACAILGGLLLQYPVGRVSDHMDRRWMLLLLGILGLTGSLMGFMVTLTGPWLYLLAFLAGGAALPMYAISLAHGNDNAEGRFLEIASGMLMANALGAIVAPLIYGACAALGLEHAFLGILAGSFALSVAWTLARLGSHPVQREHFEPFAPLPKTTLEAAAMDPRGDAAEAPSADWLTDRERA